MAKSATFIGPDSFKQVSEHNAMEILMEFHDIILQKDILGSSTGKNMRFEIGSTVVNFKNHQELKSYYNAWSKVSKMMGELGKKGGFAQKFKVNMLKSALSKWLSSFIVSFDISINKKTTKHDQAIQFSFKDSSEIYAFKNHDVLKTYVMALGYLIRSSNLK